MGIERDIEQLKGNEKQSAYPVEDRRGSFMTIPLSERGVPKFFVYLFSAVGLVYLSNPTAGLIELIPDITPFIGNLDEGGAFLLLWYGLLEFFEGRRRRREG